MFDLDRHHQWLEPDAMVALNRLKRQVLAEGKLLLDFSVLNPDIPPPTWLTDKLLEYTVKTNSHRYTVSGGIRRLKEAFACKYSKRFGVSLNPECDICVCMGVKDGLQRLLQCLMPKGRGRVLVGKPCYPSYLAILRLVGFEFDFFEIGDHEDCALRSLIVKLEDGNFDGVLLNFPNNPTGLSVGRNFYRQLKPYLEKAGVWVINDFVYGEMLHNGMAACSMLAEPGMREMGVELYSLSKAYSLAGWHLGAALGNSCWLSRLSRLKAEVDWGNFLPIQEAGVQALTADCSLIDPIVSTYARRAAVLAAGLRRLNWNVCQTNAGAVIWARYPAGWGSEGSVRLACRMLQKLGVLPLPGKVFGEEFDAYLRFALVLSEENIYEALNRLARLDVDASEIQGALVPKAG